MCSDVQKFSHYKQSSRKFSSDIYTFFLHENREKGRAEQKKFSSSLYVCLSFFARFQCNEEYLFTHLMYIFVFAFRFLNMNIVILPFFLNLRVLYLTVCLRLSVSLSYFHSSFSLYKTNLFRTRIANLFSLLIFTLSYIDVCAENKRKLKANMNNG